MIEKVVKKGLITDDLDSADLDFWLSKTPAERVEAVEILRKQFYGSSTGLQRVVRVIQRPES